MSDNPDTSDADGKTIAEVAIAIFFAAMRLIGFFGVVVSAAVFAMLVVSDMGAGVVMAYAVLGIVGMLAIPVCWNAFDPLYFIKERSRNE